MEACANDHHQVVKKLLELGAFVNVSRTSLRSWPSFATSPYAQIRPGRLFRFLANFFLLRDLALVTTIRKEGKVGNLLPLS